MPIAKANGINIYYEIHGEGEPLVLIGGYGADSSAWFLQVPVFSREYKVITFDNRGTGRSDKPDVPYTIKMMAADVKGLLDALNINAAHIWGPSMGGLIAQEFAIRYPKCVISLILGCTHCGGTHAITHPMAANRKLFDEERIKQLTERQIMEGTLPFLCNPEFIDKHHDIIEEWLTKKSEYPTPIHGYKQQAEAVMGHDTYDRLPRIKAPTLIIQGSDDMAVPMANANVLASRIPNTEIAILKGLRHTFFVEGAQEANRIILDFLKRHPYSVAL